MTIVEIISHAIFLFMGSFGIYIGVKESNYLTLVGGVGMVFVIILSLVDGKIKRKRKIDKKKMI